MKEQKYPGPVRSVQSVILALLLSVSLFSCQDTVQLESKQVQVQWKKTGDGWKIDRVNSKNGEQWNGVGVPSGEYTLLYSKNKPDSTSTPFRMTTGVVFPEPIYKYQIGHWKRYTAPVALNTAGEAFQFFPSSSEKEGEAIRFTHDLAVASFSSSWETDPRYPQDIVVKQTIVIKQDGYYSLASPSLTTLERKDVAWATVPGYFQGDSFQKNFVLSYAYGQGIPELPVVYSERCVSTLSPIVTTKENVSVSVTPKPGLARDPWAHDHNTHDDWRIGLSHMNRRAEVSPTVYHPVLGQPSSKFKAGDTLTYEVRYTIMNGEWYQNLKHVANDIYKFGKTLALRSNEQSLSDRVEAMHRYLTDSKTSMWNVESFEGRKIGGQSYLGGVVGSNGDAMKNSDYGAMWMLAHATGDDVLAKQVLPYALNFKLAQQQVSPGFFKGAVIGQYYLAKRKMFVEEWGEFIEPVSLTYYTIIDDGNILLFEPQNEELKERLRMGADLLMTWQKKDGSWEVAYHRETKQPLFTDIKDLRPTFYGLIVAFRILKDPKYLEGATKGADWMIANAVKKGHFIGVCGDARYAPDFATAQTAQAFLDLYDLTKEERYKEAATETAKLYTTSIYTHPIPSEEVKMVRDRERKDWQITQAGLSFEHGGIMGSAQRHGPIQLASHAGMFVRMFGLTNDSLFLDMARSAATGRDAFVDEKTKVASYYWNAMDKGAGPYPHHAWWQIGWITDYLLSEAALRSNGEVSFPRGFVTPKVGPHQSYGFAPGKIYGTDADLVIRDGMVKTDNANVEHITAQSADKKKLFVILMSDISSELSANVTLDLKTLDPSKKIKTITELKTGGMIPVAETLSVYLDPYGIRVYAIDLD